MADGIELKGDEYRIHEANLSWLDKKFEKMSKIAKEVGTEPPSYKIVREEYKEDKEFDEALGQWVSKGFYKNFVITVEGEAPKLAGWTFVASITHTKDGNLINKVPGIEESVPERYREGAPWCDYCQTSRRRVDSFIVRSESGEHKQIGRNCLAKFLGYSDPERVARYASWLANMEQEIADQEEKLFSGGGRRSKYRNLEEFLTMVVAVVDAQGWRSITSARGTGRPATIQEVEYQLSPYSRKDKKWQERKITPTEDQRERALAAIKFARSDKLTTDTDFKHNLKLSTASDMFHEKASGIVASLINYHERDREWELRRAQWRREADERRAKEKQSSHVGQVGERITLPVQVVRRKQLEGQFGITYMFRMLDGDGDVLVWFASNDALDEGKWYNITGTVKKLETYDGVKQTILTRCKAEEVESVVVEDEGAADPFGGAVSLPKPVAKRRLVRSKHERQPQPTSVSGIRG